MEKSKKINKKLLRLSITIVLVTLICIAVDLLTKILTDDKTFDVIPKLLSFISTHNFGAAYSSFSGQTLMLIIVSVTMIVALIVFNCFYKSKSILYCISMGLIFGGAIGNLFDRIAYGYVRDFVKFSFFNFTCNFADIFLCFGIGLFAIYLLFFSNVKNREK